MRQLRVGDPWVEAQLPRTEDVLAEARAWAAPFPSRTRRDAMRLRIGDPWCEAQLLRAEDVLAKARAFTARQALLRDSHAPRRGVRVWLGSVLLAVGHRLLGSVPTLGQPPSPGEIRGDGAR